ncbi:uncharacterized protein G2W53_003936 [Senna tora]|uniref:Uncharacterized protein n=1 Tax=Senna tora TaxID=362788 RepID=A0A834XC29_9FABA|nr:uncharacterized protein G2W53_003936 [Senna tora]
MDSILATLASNIEKPNCQLGLAPSCWSLGYPVHDLQLFGV